MESDKKSIVPISNAVSKISNQIAIGEKLLKFYISKNGRNWVKNFLLKNKKTNNFTINLLSNFYPFDEEMIYQYKNILNWRFLSNNKNINWSEKLIKKFVDRWVWKYSSVIQIGYRENGSIYDVTYDRGRYKEQLYLPQEIKYKTLLNSLSSNSSIPWDVNLISTFEDYLEFSILSGNSGVNWSEPLLEKYKFDFMRIAGNSSFPWTIDLVESHNKKHPFFWMFLSSNPRLNWSREFVGSYLHKLSAFTLIENPGIKWTEDLFFELIQKSEFKNSEKQGMGDFQRQCWRSLSRNKGFPWTLEFIEKHQNDLKWNRYPFNDGGGGLSENEGLPWSNEIFIRYFKKWDWFYLCGNSSFPWSDKIINDNLDKIYWDMLSLNTGLPWTNRFFNKYVEKWNFDVLTLNEGFYNSVIKPFLDDDFVEEILNTYIKQHPTLHS